MMILKIFFLSLTSLVVLFILTKMVGKREITQLTMFDYIVGITIGSIAAEMSTALEDFTEPLTSMIVYGGATVLIYYITAHSLKARRFMNGRPMILINNGTIYKNSLKRSKIDIHELLMEAREQGYFNISDIEVAILEVNGRISFLPKALKRPATTEDLNLNPSQDDIVMNVIADGIILKENLEIMHKDEIWLGQELQNQGITSVMEVFLATCDKNSNLSVYKKTEKEAKEDIG